MHLFESKTYCLRVKIIYPRVEMLCRRCAHIMSGDDNAKFVVLGLGKGSSKCEISCPEVNISCPRMKSKFV